MKKYQLPILIILMIIIAACSPQGPSPFSNGARNQMTEARRVVMEAREMQVGTYPSIRLLDCDDGDRLFGNRGSEIDQLVQNQTWVMLGLAAPDADFDSIAAPTPPQPGAFFSIETNNLSLLMTDCSDERIDDINRMSDAELAVYLRAFVQFMQNRNLNLRSVFITARSNADQQQAVLALSNGDSILATRAFIEQIEDLSDEEREQLSASTYASNLTSAESADFFKEQTAFSWVAGASFVEALFNEGGWDAVNAAFDNPPSSTEQILHPERYLSDDEPLAISVNTVSNLFGVEEINLSSGTMIGQANINAIESGSFVDPVDEEAEEGAGLEGGTTDGGEELNNLEGAETAPTEATIPETEWVKLNENNFGELLLRQHLGAYLDAALVDVAATGWGGDEYAIYYRNASDDRAMIWRLALDTEQDYEEFVSAYRLLLDARMGAAGEPGANGAECWQGTEEVACLLTDSAALAAAQNNEIGNQLAIAYAPTLELAQAMIEIQVTPAQ